jgi:RNA polymerase sigma-70 factor, ECF subfamily
VPSKAASRSNCLILEGILPSDPNDLVPPFLEALPPELRDTAVPENLEATLRAIVDQARTAWPGLVVEPAAFVRTVAQRLSTDVPLHDGLAALRGPDLYLARACASGDATAIEAFESTFADEIERSVEKMAGDAIRSDDFKQEFRQKLFLGKEGGGPKISEYSGRGSLRRWVRITAKRTYIDLMRVGQRMPEVPMGDEPLVDEGAAQLDPELAYVKRRYQHEFKEAFGGALGQLSPRQRNLLRHHFVHRLRLDEIAGIYRVHRATVARWIADARKQLLVQTREALEAQLSVNSQEFQSIVRLVQGELDLTVSRLLKKKP